VFSYLTLCKALLPAYLKDQNLLNVGIKGINGIEGFDFVGMSKFIIIFLVLALL